MLLLSFTAFFFGTFSFNVREYLALAGLATFGDGALLLLKYPPAQRGSEAFRFALLHFMIVIVILLWVSLLGGDIAGLRAHLAGKKDALAPALARVKDLASRDELTGLRNCRRLRASGAIAPACSAL